MAEHRAVQVDQAHDIGKGHGKVRSGGDADAALEHAAQHAVALVAPRQLGHLDGLADTGHFHQLDVDQVGTVGGKNLQYIVHTARRFVGQDRRAGVRGNESQAGAIVGRHGLLHAGQIDTGIFERLDDAHRLLGAPGLVGVQKQLDLGAHSAVNGQRVVYIGAPIGCAHFDFQRIKALRHRCQTVLHHGGAIVQADGDVGLEARRAAAQQLVERHAKLLGAQVVQRNFQRRFEAVVVQQSLVHDGQQCVEIAQVFADQARRNQRQRCAHAAQGVAGDHRRGRGLAVAGVAGVGLYAQNQILQLGDGAQSRLEGGF